MNPRIENIGNLKGEILVFGGVYSNLEALVALVEIAKERNISSKNIICTGDIVAYCANPEECLQFVKNWGIHVILGNVEIQLRDNLDDCGCNFSSDSRCGIFSRQWFPFAKANVSEDSISWIKSLPDHLQFTFGEKNCYVIHGSVEETAGYVFKSTDWEEKNNNFNKVKADLILAGHCGLPFSEEKNNKYWFNSGAIGMPANDGTTDTWYAILDNDFKFSHERLRYNHEQAHLKMIASKLPQEYAKTLLTGIWDNCDILPEFEKSQQGEKFDLN
jgi:predicted phosphodiesterase